MNWKSAGKVVLAEGRAIVKPREYFDGLVSDTFEQWIQLKMPKKLWAPTLRSKARSASPHSRTTLLSGKIPNLQTSYEAHCRGETLPEAIKPDRGQPSTLVEAACMLTEDANSFECSIARVVCFTSETARDEANAIGFSLLLYLFLEENVSQEDHAEIVAGKLKSLMDSESAIFLSYLICNSMHVLNIKTNGRAEEGIVPITIMDFWIKGGGEKVAERCKLSD